ncbi:MAG: GH92 family glycosyl hydrolase [Muribaculaceae bacterium]|nr:GH92 family glycosyl hydrolase [Muribaculaceae bacterium]
MKLIFHILILIFGSLQLTASRYNEFVDPQILRDNTDNDLYNNNCLGATLPSGRICVYLKPQKKYVKEIDIDKASDSCFYGFCHTKIENSELNHLLDICLMPTTEEEKETACHYKTLDWKPGYCKVLLEDSLIAETTATLRTGIHNYSYPQGKNKMLWLSLFQNMSDSISKKKEIIKSQIRKTDKTSIEGYQIIKNNHSIDKVYFCIQFSEDIKSFALVNDDGKIIEVYGKNGLNSLNPKALLSFDNDTNSLLIKVGLSDISIENAKENLGKEASNQDFSNFVSQADSIWERNLGKIEVKGIEKNKIQFYTALYKTFLQSRIESDINGEWINPDMSISRVPEKETQFSLSNLGDSFRLINPLFTLINPEITKNFVKSMLRLFDFEGYLYVGDVIDKDLNLIKETQIIPIIVDAVLKRIPGIDSQKVWDMIKTYSLVYEQNSPAEIFERYGYIPENYFPQSVNYTLEKSFEEWCTVRLAGIYGDAETKTKLNERAHNYRNIYNKEINSFSPKDIEGKWIIKEGSRDYSDKLDRLIDSETMGSYYWYVHYDIKDIIRLSGGKESFEKQLDNLFNFYKDNFNETSQNHSKGFDNLKKSFLHAPYLYNYIGKTKKTRKALTQLMVESPIIKIKNTQVSDDGLLAAWYIFSSMGFYPVNPCGGYFDLGYPFFDECILHLPNGKDFVIVTDRKEENPFKSVKITLNDKPVKKNYITYEDIMHGGKLVFGS